MSLPDHAFQDFQHHADEDKLKEKVERAEEERNLPLAQVQSVCAGLMELQKIEFSKLLSTQKRLTIIRSSNLTSCTFPHRESVKNLKEKGDVDG